LAVDTWRWAGVPFRLRAGKALSTLRKEAVITFKQPPWVPTGLTGYDRPDRLRIGFDPDRLDLDLNINGPGDPLVVDPITMQADFGPGDLSAYGEVLKGVFDGDPHYRCGATQPWNAGASSNRSSKPGAMTRCPCRNTRPAVPGPTTEPDH
jgi:glucose-6-phosphate 1-dehydrogenase